MIHKRIKWLDFGKGFTIFLVVLGHAITEILTSPSVNISSTDLYIFKLGNYIIFLIIMPTFFAMSGYLYKPVSNIHAFIKNIKKKFFSLICPYALFCFIFIFLSIITDTSVQGAHGITSLLTMWINPLGYLWYLYVLFFAFCLVDILNLLKISYPIQFILVLIAFFIGVYIGGENTIGKILMWTFCFYIGFCIKEFHLLNKRNNIYMIIGYIVFFLIAALILIFQNNWTFSANQFNWFNILPKLISIFLLFDFFTFVNTSKRGAIYLMKCGQASLIIYLVHVPVILFVQRICGNINNSWLNFIILFVVGWIVSVIISKISNRFMLLNYMFYPQKLIKRLKK